MNIFQVLSQGKSRLHEPSMSAMLGYLLDSNKDHGLGDAFIRVFLSKINFNYFKEILDMPFIDSQVTLELPLQFNGAEKDIDIEIILLDSQKNEDGVKNKLFRIIIENKIKAGAANPKQLNEYYYAVLEDEPDIENLIMIFLTPESITQQLKAEFENFITLPATHHKEWIFWDSQSNIGIVSMVRDILKMEAQGEINPINEYMRHTLKAFVRHITDAIQPVNSRKLRTGEDIGEIIEEAVITLQGGISYRIVRRDSSQIQAYNAETDEKVPARTILIQFIEENNLDIQHNPKDNTRFIGKLFFQWYSKNNT